jgi:hypothetical protein
MVQGQIAAQDTELIDVPMVMDPIETTVVIEATVSLLCPLI